MVARRPFATESDMLDAAEKVWRRLNGADWREAFASHPQIGEDGTDQRWSQQEQSGMRSADLDTRRKIAEANRAYLKTFGYIFIVCAAGKTSEEMLAILKARLKNDPAKEIRIAAGEQGKITRLRLRKIVSS